MTKIVLWVSDLEAQIAFYSRLFDVDAPSASGGFAEVAGGGNSVLLHKLPDEYSAATPLSKQLSVQDEVAIKPVFTVDSISAAQQRTAGTFASFAATKNAYGEFEYQDAVDPEGNVIQLEQKL